MSKNKRASTKKAKTTKVVKPAKPQTEMKDVFIVRAEFTIGERAYKPGDTFKVPAGWTRNTHQEGVLNPKQTGKSFCFDEVILRDKETNEVMRTVTHILPLTLKAQAPSKK